jgi:F-type H+-transporting ATPase subunit delta
MSLAVANRYARALSDLVMLPQPSVSPEAVLDQLRGFHKALESSPELQAALMSPAVAAAAKHRVAGKVAERLAMARMVRNFIFVIIDHRRIPLVGRIVEAFEKAVDDRLGRVRATISSAAPLDEQQQRKLEDRLTATTRRQVRSDFRVNPDLMGGVSVQIGSTIYDGSVRGRLAALRARMTAE